MGDQILPAALWVAVAVLGGWLALRVRYVGAGSSPPEASTPPAPPEDSATEQIAVPDGVRIHMVSRSDIQWVEADGDHICIHTTDRTYRTRATLAAYARELRVHGFLRIHRSALVHPRALREVQKLYRGDHVAVLKDGTEIRIPRTRKEIVSELLSPIGHG